MENCVRWTPVRRPDWGLGGSPVLKHCSMIFRYHSLMASVGCATTPPVSMRSIAISMSVCLYVCLSFSLSARISYKPRIETLQNFLGVLPVAVTRFFSDDSAIRYVLPVMWITSYFHMMGTLAGGFCYEKIVVIRYDTIRYDTVYLRAFKSWRDGQTNLAHGT